MHASTWFNQAQVDSVRVVPFKSANPAVVGSSVAFCHVPYKEREVNFKRLLFLKILKVCFVVKVFIIVQWNRGSIEYPENKRVSIWSIFSNACQQCVTTFWDDHLVFRSVWMNFRRFSWIFS